MDYERIKAEVSEIAEIASSVPEPFRDQTFELLLGQLLRETGEPAQDRERDRTDRNGDPRGGAGRERPDDEIRNDRTDIPTPASVKVFMRRTEVTAEELSNVVAYEGGEIHFVREPSHNVVATGQIEWALLLALKNGIESGNLEVDAEAVRSICQDRGYYDRGNFSSTFKKKKNAALFKSPLEPQGDAQALSQEGVDELGKLVKQLASES